MSKDLFHNINVASAMQEEDFSATANGTAIDTQGYESLTFIVTVGANTGNAFDATNNITFKVQKDDNSGMTSPTDLAAGDYLGGKTAADASWDRILDAAADDEQDYVIGVDLNDPDSRYYRLVATEAGTVTTVDLYASAVRGHARHLPKG
jgi:hypothetical protein